MFHQVTGKAPPNSPVTAYTHASHGYPYFAFYDEMPSGIVGQFEEVKSVSQLDKEGKPTSEKKDAVAEVEQSTNNPVVLLNYKGDRVGFRTVAAMESEVREKFGKLKIVSEQQQTPSVSMS